MTDAGRSCAEGSATRSAWLTPGRDHPDGQVADHLAARRHLDRTPQQDVRVVVGLEHLGEPVAHAERVGLRAQVRQLTAGDLVAVDAGRGRALPGLEGRVEVADRVPVRLEQRGIAQVESAADGRIAVGVRHGGEQGAEAGLAPARRHRRGGAVDAVDARLDGGEVRGELATGGVVGVQVHRAGRSARAAPTRAAVAAGGRSRPAMSLMTRTCAPAIDDLLGQAQVVVEGVGGLGGVEDVAGVAERDLGVRPPARARRRSRAASARRC